MSSIHLGLYIWSNRDQTYRDYKEEAILHYIKLSSILSDKANSYTPFYDAMNNPVTCVEAASTLAEVSNLRTI